MKTINRKYLILFAAAVAIAAVLVGMRVPGTLAYFTDQDKSEGTAGVKLAWNTVLKEEVKDNNKHVTIKNEGDTKAVVRVAVFAPDFAKIQDNGSWVEKNGWWYYKEILDPGKTTDELFVEVKDAPDKDFNIIVLHESSRVVYADNETLRVPDGWDYAPEV